MAAFDYRDVQAPSILPSAKDIPDNGVASAAQALAGAFKDFGTDAYDMGAAVRTKQGDQAGALAGSTGDPDLKSGLGAFTIYGQAYNNSATRSYAIQAEATAEDTASKLQTEANNDPDLFKHTYAAARDATVKAAPPEAQGIIANLYNARLSSGVAALAKGQADQIQQADRVNLSEGVARQTDRVAQLRAAGDPSSLQQADEEQVKLNLLIDGARNTNTISQTEQASMHMDSQRAILMQTTEAQFARVLQDPNGDPAGYIEKLQAANRNGGQTLSTTKYDVKPGNAAAADPASWDKREDGSQKGNGFLGLLQRPDGGVSSEISIGVEVNGKEMEVPTMVPTLNQKELDYLMTHKPDPATMPKSIVQKAIAFAQQRMADGKPVFAGPDDAPQAGASRQILDPDEEHKVTQNLFATLRQQNELESMGRRNGKTEEQIRLEAGDRMYTGLLFSGQLTVQKLYEGVTSQNLKPETARALMGQLNSGDNQHSDPKTLFNYKTDLLNHTPADIAANPNLSWADKSTLTNEFQDRSNGWEGTQNAKEAKGRIDRALGIVPGTMMQTLTDAQKTQRQTALTQWYDKMSAIDPAQRETSAIPTAQTIIGNTFRVNAQSTSQRATANLSAFQKQAGDPTKMDKEARANYDSTVARYNHMIATANAEAARQQ